METAVSAGVLRRWSGLIAAAVAFVVILLLPEFEAGRPAVQRTAAVAAMMAILWITEAIPLAATALIPVFVFPLLGVAEADQIARSYFNSVIFLFLGGFLIAIAMERWQLHRRIALWIVLRFGGGAASANLAFMSAAFFISMWISNTATAVMMLPMALATLSRLDESAPSDLVRPFSKALLLGLAYACSIGGVATLVGTPPNLILVGAYRSAFPDEAPISFAQWTLVWAPYAALMLLCAWLLLSFVFFPARGLRVDRQALRAELQALGPMGPEERQVAAVFALTALLWITRAPLDLGLMHFPGWAAWLPFGEFIDDGAVAVAAALSLFLLPAGDGKRLLDEAALQRVPWGIIILFGGGFALAGAFVKSGLSTFLVHSLAGGDSAGDFWLSVQVATGMTFLTELTSNTASAQMAMPVLAALAEARGLPPLSLMMPAAISASMAFMLPVATPPNAVVFSSGRIRVSEMALCGFFLNLLGVVFTVFTAWFLAPLILFGHAQP